jgi:hypothetical protein
MNKLLITLLSESDSISDVSLLRLMSILALLTGIGLAIVGRDYQTVGVFVTNAFAFKAIQKFAEK